MSTARVKSSDSRSPAKASLNSHPGFTGLQQLSGPGPGGSQVPRYATDDLEQMRRILGRRHTELFLQKGVSLQQLVDMSRPDLVHSLDDIAVSREDRWLLDRQVRALRRKQDANGRTSTSAILLSLGRNTKLSDSDVRRLLRAGIYNFDDWLKNGSSIKLSNKARRILDGYARFSKIDLYGDIVEKLLSNGVESPLVLAEYGEVEFGKIARRAGIRSKYHDQLLARADVYRQNVLRTVLHTLIHQDGENPALASTQQTAGVCPSCSHHETVFSRYAYFLYLIHQTRLTTSELDDRLHQDFASITPASGHDEAEVSQLEICTQVLRRAFPGQPTPAHRWRYDRHLLAAQLRLIPVPLGQFFQVLAARLGYTGQALAALGASLEGLLVSELESEHPQLSQQQYQATYVLLEEMYIVRQFAFVDKTIDEFMADTLQVNSTLNGPDLRSRFESALAGDYSSSGGTFSHVERLAMQTVADQSLNGDGFRLLVDPLRRAREEAKPALRDACKLHSNKTDRQLFSQLFIETDLPACEKITPLDQAIRTLEAFLDHLVDVTTDPGGRRAYEYLNYDAWRVFTMSEYYPELRALWKDDVLTGESESWDRGSILFDSANRRQALKTSLSDARSILESARINVGKDGLYFRDNPEQINSTAHTVAFSDMTHFAAVTEGLDCIEAVLQADELIQEGIRELDSDESGLAIGKYQQALARLDHVAELLFGPDSPWDFLGQRGDAVYRSLQDEHPREYWTKLIDLHSRLLGGDKRLFRDRTLVDAGWFFIDPDEWQFPPTGGFALSGASAIKHQRTSQDAQTKHRCYYGDGGSLTDYRFSGRINMESGGLRQSLSVGEQIGVGVRMRAVGGDQRGYAAVVTPRNVHFNGGSVNRDFFRLVKKNDGGGETLLWESDESITFEAGANYNVHLECRNVVDANTVTGTSLVATISGPGTSVTSPAVVDDDPYVDGTFGFYCTARIEARFVPFIDVLPPAQTTAPPFFAPRRQALDSFHLLSQGNQALRGHHDNGATLALDVSEFDILQDTGFIQFEKLAGLKTPVGNGHVDQFLLFKVGEKRVSLNTLDLLLEHLLMLGFHIRFAVLPMRLAQAYFQAGDYQTAADYFHMLYDDGATLGGPPMPGFEDPSLVYPGLARPPATLGPSTSLDARLMQLRLGEVYLAWADWLFQKNTDESKYQARQLYERVLSMYGDTGHCACFPSIGEVFETVAVFPLDASGPSGTEDFEHLVDRFDLAERNGWSLADAFNNRPSRSARKPATRLRQQLNRLETRITERRKQTETGYSIEALEDRSRRLLQAAEPAYLRSFAGSPLAAPGSATATILWPAYWFVSLCIPENPVKAQQRRHACHMLDLLRSCRNILGFTRSAVPEFRFESLLELALNHVVLAKTAERDLLQFRQRFESETFSERDAESNVVLSRAQLALEELNVAQAIGEVRLASLQRGQAYHSLSHYEQLIREGWTTAEQIAFGTSAAASAVSVLNILPVIVAGGLSVAGGITSLTAGGATASTGVGAPAGAAISAAGVLGALATGVGALASSGQSVSSALNSVSSTASMYASFERRDQEWRFQAEQSRYALASASQAVLQAAGRVDMARQSRFITSLRHDFAFDTLSFLKYRFLNSAMWLWMQAEIRKEYRLRLHYAITVAHMAEQALRFETQDDGVNVIGFDYYDPQRDGLLGATKLETDLATLRQLRLESEKRKLQLTKVVSLSRLLPMDFERLRRTGSLPFRTLLQWFDEDFPGHYLRLIKSVRVSVMALTPPIGGIKATLRCNGVSTAVVESDGGFTEQLIRREPQSIAFSSPVNADGLFQLQPNEPLLLPFEGLGVETDWVLELPKDSNAFDFSTLADVIVEIDYTALESEIYRRTVKQRLGSDRVFDLAVSAGLYFPDEWYHFHNPLDPSAGHGLTMKVESFHLPANIDADSTKAYHVSVLVRGSLSSHEADSIKSMFRLAKDGTVFTSAAASGPSQQTFQTVAAEKDAILLSTHVPGQTAGNGPAPLDLPARGDWTISADAAIDAVTTAAGTPILEQIEDIVLVVSITGQVG